MLFGKASACERELNHASFKNLAHFNERLGPTASRRVISEIMLETIVQLSVAVDRELSNLFRCDLLLRNLININYIAVPAVIRAARQGNRPDRDAPISPAFQTSKTTWKKRLRERWRRMNAVPESPGRRFVGGGARVIRAAAKGRLRRGATDRKARWPPPWRH